MWFQLRNGKYFRRNWFEFRGNDAENVVYSAEWPAIDIEMNEIQSMNEMRMDCRVNPDVSDSLFCAIKMLRVKDKIMKSLPHRTSTGKLDFSIHLLFMSSLSPIQSSPLATRFMTIDIFFNFPPRINVVMSCSVPGATTSFSIQFYSPTHKSESITEKIMEQFRCLFLFRHRNWAFLVLSYSRTKRRIRKIKSLRQSLDPAFSTSPAPLTTSKIYQ